MSRMYSDLLPTDDGELAAGGLAKCERWHGLWRYGGWRQWAIGASITFASITFASITLASITVAFITVAILALKTCREQVHNLLAAYFEKAHAEGSDTRAVEQSRRGASLHRDAGVRLAGSGLAKC